MRNGYDGGRPYSVHVNGDWWRVAEACYDGVSGIEPYAAIDWFAVINPGILVLSGGNAWKQGGGMWADTSKRRFKEDITSFDGGLARCCASGLAATNLTAKPTQPPTGGIMSA